MRGGSRLALVRQRTVWLPTRWGWLLLLVLAAAALGLALRGLYPFLALNQPVGAKVLVVEGWLGPRELDQAIVAFRKGGYERAVATGTPFESWPRGMPYRTSAERAADYLRSHGLPEPSVVLVPAPESLRDRTFVMAIAVREWAKQSGLELRSLDVFSKGAHARRSRLVYQMAFGPGVEVGVLAADTPPSDEHWWRSAYGTREVFDQAVAFAWTKLFFRPGQNPE